jgi:hypothetical protein
MTGAPDVFFFLLKTGAPDVGLLTSVQFLFSSFMEIVRLESF